MNSYDKMMHCPQIYIILNSTAKCAFSHPIVTNDDIIGYSNNIAIYKLFNSE